MSPDRLHPSLDAGPSAKPICIGCGAANDRAVLTPVNDSRTVFLCLSCASLTCLQAHAEVFRRAAQSFVDLVSPEVTA